MKQDFRIRFLGGEFATTMTCKEANCTAYQKGWVVVLDIGTETGALQATWIKQKSRRRFWEWDSAHALEGAYKLQASGDITVTEPLRAMLASLALGMVVFVFPPGQACFKEHLDREVIFKHDNFVHVKPLEFNEDFNEQADKVNTAIQRG